MKIKYDFYKNTKDKEMKNFNTLEELREALMSEDGAVYGAQRFRIYDLHLENFRGNYWVNGVGVFNHGFLFDLENWSCYEKPKKIVKEEIEGFVGDMGVSYFEKHGRLVIQKESDRAFKTKAKLIIEREVDDE